MAVVYKLSEGNYNLKVITPESRTRQLFHLHGRRDITRKHLDIVAISTKNTPKMLNASALLRAGLSFIAKMTKPRGINTMDVNFNRRDKALLKFNIYPLIKP